MFFFQNVYILTTQFQLPLDINNETNWFNWKKLENMMRKLTILLSEKL
jgi:hypothetical protein